MAAKGWIIGALVVAGAGAGAWIYLDRDTESGPTVPTIVVDKERFTRRITAEGNLKAVEATPVTPPPPRGRPRPMKIAWLAPDGSKVEAGEVIMRFDPTEFERQLKDGEADQSAVGAKLSQERIQAGAAEGNRKTSHDLAKLALEKNRKIKAVDEEIYSRHQMAESKIDETLSQARMDHAREAESIERRLTGSKLALLQVEKRKADLAVEQATSGLEGLEVKAPHAGILVLRRNWRGEVKREGEQVWPGETVAEIPILSDMEAQVFVLEVDGGGLSADLSAVVVIEARPGIEYPAVVKHVDDLAQPRIRDLPVQYFSVTLSLESTEPEVMKPGQRVRATLILDKDDALVVPRQAVIDRDGKNVVFVLSGNTFTPTEVELGPSTPGRVVIESGLEPGSRIALRDPTAVVGAKQGGNSASAGSSP